MNEEDFDVRSKRAEYLDVRCQKSDVRGLRAERW
jgi:hypothetical protein